MGRKSKIVLSDLHLGAGHADDGSNRLEDFVADEKLVYLLREIGRESKRDQLDIELIINGDFLEFLQVPAVDNYDPQINYPVAAYLDSSEEASVQRLNIIIDGHQEVFNALSDFMRIEAPQRRITIIKGNHDVNIYWPGVKSRLREILGATGSRASLLLFAGEFVSREKIYVEHGHQHAEKMNAFHDFIDPRLPSDPTQLSYPAGSHFVINFFNEVERERWFVDSVKPLTALIWYALQWDFNFAAKMLVSFVQHTPALVVSDYDLNNNGIIPADSLLASLADADERFKISQRYATDRNFRQQFHQQIQQYLEDSLIANKRGDHDTTTDVSDDPLAMARAEQQRQQAALGRAAEDVAKEEGAEVILFGHSHYPAHQKLDTGSTYINTGCWLWNQDLTTVSSDIWEALFNDTQFIRNTYGSLPYARIDYDDDDNPTARLLDAASGNPLTLPEDSKASTFVSKILNRFIPPSDLESS